VFQDELDLQANASFVQGSGARAFGMGGAFLARADDATAASWNPAGLSYLRAPELSFVFTNTDFEVQVQAPGIDRFTREGTEYDFDFVRRTRDDRSGTYPDFIAFTWPWETADLSGAVQFSFQRVIPFAGRRSISDTFTGTATNLTTHEATPREAQTTRSVESIGGFDILALGTGVRVTRQLRVGVAVNRWFHGYEQTVSRRDQFIPSRQESQLGISGWNVHLGAIFSPWESLNLGFVFKSAFTADVRLDRVRYDEFPAIEVPPTPARANFNLYSREDVRLDLPGAIGFGVSWRPRSNLTLSVDYTRTNWSDGAIRNFFALPRASFTSPLEYPAPTPLETRDFCGEYPPDVIPPVNPCPPELPYPTLDTGNVQADTGQVRAGIEYVIIRNRLKFPVRAGVFRDGQFFRTLQGDAPSFDGFTLGTGLILNDVLLDVAYVYESGRYTDRNIVVGTVVDPDTNEELTRVVRGPGDNDVKSHKVYASLIVRLPRRR
jgi:long-subunit fatty acid transport protein